jgi:hypothetical protein
MVDFQEAAKSDDYQRYALLDHQMQGHSRSLLLCT